MDFENTSRAASRACEVVACFQDAFFAPRLNHFVDTADEGIVQRCRRTGFALKALVGGRKLVYPTREGLQGDLTVQQLIPG